jgi:hypothetical protein
MDARGERSNEQNLKGSHQARRFFGGHYYSTAVAGWKAFVRENEGLYQEQSLFGGCRRRLLRFRLLSGNLDLVYLLDEKLSSTKFH